jgi:CheY-like chemotaxis protein
MNASHRILIVDDEPNNCKTLQAILSPLGHSIHVAHDGRAGLQLAQAIRPDLILLDVMMPALDGYEVCRRLRADPQLAEVPIIIITALDDRDSRLAGLEAGADDFVPKPFDRLELRARVQTVIRLNRYRQLTFERSRFAWMAEQSDDGYLLLTQADQIVYANLAARRFLGLAPDADIAQAGPFAALSAARHQVVALADPDQALLVRAETEAERGQWLRVQSFTVPGRVAAGPAAQGDAVRFVQLRDISQEMELQRGTWSFGSIVAHKLRSPVAAISGSLDLLAEFIDPEAVPGSGDMLSLAQNSARQLRHAVDEVVRFATGPNEAERGAPFSTRDLPALVAALAVDLSLSSVQVELDGDVPVTPLALAGLTMRLILAELLDNARKFHPHGGQPKIRVRARAWRPAEAAAGVLLIISDDGRHLSPDQLSRIWEPYYQVEKLFTGQVQGMGLGLSMIRGIVLSAGGECQALNVADGPGLSIELRLPFKREGDGHATGLVYGVEQRQ